VVTLDGGHPGFRHLGDRVVHEGHIWTVVVADFESPDGDRFHRDIVRSPGAVGVVPILFDPEGVPSTVLLRQYRPAFDTEIIEIPAGMRDVPGEPPELTAARELIEEVGLAAGSLMWLARLRPSPGMTDSTTEVFLASGCRSVDPDLQGPEERHMTTLHMSLAEAEAMVHRGEITDAKSVIGILAAARHLAHGDTGGST
jgi:ADP-ribose pyrophosphatase